MAPREGIWPGPSGPTVWESQLREGLKRALNPATDVPVRPGFPGGGPQKTAAGIQDILMGLGQAVSSPVAGLLSPFAPAMQASLDLPIPNPADALQGRESNTKLRDLLETVVGASNAIGDAGSELTGYDKERSRELSGAGLMALAGPAAKAVPKVGAGIEGMLNKVGMTAKSDPSQMNSFVNLTHLRHRPDLEDKYLEADTKKQKGLLSTEQIREQTGWDKNEATGLMRYEVSDKGFKLKNPFTNIMQVLNATPSGKIILPFRAIAEHPELEKIDPTLLDIALEFNKRESGGSFLPLNTSASDELTAKHPDSLPRSLVNDPRALISLGLQPWAREGVDHGAGIMQVKERDFMDTLIHEIQHNIQQKSQGGSYGSSSPDPTTYHRNAGEVEARLTAIRRLLNLTERRQHSPSRGLFSQDVDWPLQLLDQSTTGIGREYGGWQGWRPKDKRKEY